MNKESSAYYHLNHVCPLCPETRRLTRDVEDCGECWWYSNWANGNYNVPRTFGVLNYVRASFGRPTKLDQFKTN